MILDPASLYVVESIDGNVLLGRVDQSGRTLTVRSGFVGRPSVLDVDDVEEIIPAREHPSIVWFD